MTEQWASDIQKWETCTGWEYADAEDLRDELWNRLIMRCQDQIVQTDSGTNIMHLLF